MSLNETKLTLLEKNNKTDTILLLATRGLLSDFQCEIKLYYSTANYMYNLK